MSIKQKDIEGLLNALGKLCGDRTDVLCKTYFRVEFFKSERTVLQQNWIVNGQEETALVAPLLAETSRLFIALNGHYENKPSEDNWEVVVHGCSSGTNLKLSRTLKVEFVLRSSTEAQLTLKTMLSEELCLDNKGVYTLLRSTPTMDNILVEQEA